MSGFGNPPVAAWTKVNINRHDREELGAKQGTVRCSNPPKHAESIGTHVTDVVKERQPSGGGKGDSAWRDDEQSRGWHDSLVVQDFTSEEVITFERVLHPVLRRMFVSGVRGAWLGYNPPPI